MKVLTVLGARPQFIKAAAVSRVIGGCTNIKEVIIHTGQHYDHNMSEVFFCEMNIPKPQYNLNINAVNHGAMTGRMIEGIEELIIKEQPDWVLVYGDTNSTIAGALAAVKLHKKVAHVEAGLRSYNMDMPEEVNRILTDRISDVLFCPTSTAVNNLNREGFEQFNSEIVNVGDVMYDASLFYQKHAQKPLFDVPSEFIIATIHRAENTDYSDRLNSIFEALHDIALNIPIVLPLHPRTRKKLNEMNVKIDNKNIIIIEPVGYFEMLYLLNHCSLVMTDSGGVQKEAYFSKKFCVTLRDQTEWVELVDNEYNVLTGANTNKIINETNSMLDKKKSFDLNLYGTGDASEKIINSLLKT